MAEERTFREEIQELLTLQAQALVNGNPDEALGTFAQEDGNFPVVAQLFHALSDEGVIGCHIRSEALLRAKETGSMDLVFSSDLILEEREPLRLRFHYRVGRGKEGRLVVRRGAFGYRSLSDSVDAGALEVNTEPDQDAQKGSWIHEGRTELARQTPDPHSLAESGRAAEACMRYLDVNPALASALVLANMMSERVARVARAVRTDDPAALLGRLHRYHRGALEHLENHPDPETANVDFFNARYTLFDDACLHRAEAGKAFAVCGGLAIFNLAVLHVAGVGPKEILHVGLKSSFTIHEVLLWDSPSGPYLASNGFFEPWGPRNFYEMQRVYRLLNAAFYADDRGGISNLGRAEAHDIHRRFSGPFAPFDFSLLDLCDGPDQQTKAPCTWPHEPSAEAWREWVWRESHAHPDSHATLARYAFRSLLVRHPEAYLCHDMESGVVELAATRRELPLETAGWLREQVTRPSIYWEPERLMRAEDVLAFGRGGALDISAALVSILRRRGVPCALALSEDDVGVCVLVGDGAGTEVPEKASAMLRPHVPGDDAPLRGAPLLVMDERAAYAPLLGRSDRIARFAPVVECR